MCLWLKTKNVKNVEYAFSCQAVKGAIIVEVERSIREMCVQRVSESRGEERRCLCASDTCRPRKHRKPKAVCWRWGEDLVVAGGERGGGGEAAAAERGEATRAPHAAAFARPPCRAPSAPPRPRRDV
ncbi:hypothetical protein RR48_08989 [Papilio machaon]|uniref:Uncharacterized protein n=1 Tax=Papilio machaon TaxID=76193 RepID=A0A194QYF3_PAPMA|nr:hypothetical protein RR48_08989 [Papilio machaon]